MAIWQEVTNSGLCQSWTAWIPLQIVLLQAPLWSTRAENVSLSSHPTSKSSSPTVSFFTNATAGVTPLVHCFPFAENTQAFSQPEFPFSNA